MAEERSFIVIMGVLAFNQNH